MESLHSAVIAEIDEFLSQHSMAPTTFGRLFANGGGAFVKQVKEGRDITLGTADRVRKSMREYSDTSTLSVAPASAINATQHSDSLGEVNH